MLYQFHWQNPERPTETRLIAYREFTMPEHDKADKDAKQKALQQYETERTAWRDMIAAKHADSKPEGWHFVLVREDHELFVRSKRKENAAAQVPAGIDEEE